MYRDFKLVSLDLRVGRFASASFPQYFILFTNLVRAIWNNWGALFCHLRLSLGSNLTYVSSPLVRFQRFITWHISLVARLIIFHLPLWFFLHVLLISAKQYGSQLCKGYTRDHQSGIMSEGGKIDSTAKYIMESSYIFHVFVYNSS